MEERVPTEGGDSSDEPPPHPRPPPPDHDQILKPSRCFSSRNKSIKHPSPLPTESETYIVQIPKDQIFSIPPTENAAIAERHRLPQKKEQRSCCNRWLCIIVTLILLALIIGTIILTCRFLFTPKAPLFTVANLIVKNPPSTRNKSNPGYQITFETKNPNGRMSISYGSEGDATLEYKNHKIGTGKFPKLDHDADSLTNFKLDLKGTKGALPDDVERSIEDRKGKKHVSLSIEMDIPIKMKVLGWLKSSSKEINVVCTFNVSSLGAGKAVLSQKCQSKFK
ncbi:hypothetical protein OIU76_024943 [Salix suchowensis]|uniref:Late embryogenesis abundant protein LEA-2 subgroup domain-containing protein n=1 Tax=Salix suchowensis TaxID=1278906 RepID=A0ABQ9AX26_9ROSI|nr:hydroxyproline-rich glycoprotein [Salix suchowensis]KAJ6289049.1 hypothetical protein OIU76_024943 [Salix suchowensis]KAJ6366146.1 hypothetical protein OIU77_002678 [Salix suchowensis]KAJ6378155.1 hypothetical protein OIU78_028400 [Salix suchowensis]